MSFIGEWCREHTVSKQRDRLIEIGGKEKLRRDSESGADFYKWHTETLRAWLVGLGVGLVGLLLTRPELFIGLRASDKFYVIVLILGGVFCQIISAIANKYTQWLNHHGAQTLLSKNPDAERRDRFAIAEWYSEKILADFLFDMFTILFFVAATCLLLASLWPKFW